MQSDHIELSTPKIEVSVPPLQLQATMGFKEKFRILPSLRLRVARVGPKPEFRKRQLNFMSLHAIMRYHSSGKIKV